MRKKSRYPFLLLTLPSVVVIAVVVALMNWRIPTRVQVELTADRAMFTVGGTDTAQILNTVGFESLTVEAFARIVFSPKTLEVANPAQYLPREDRYPPSAWTSLTVTPPVVLTGEDDALQPTVTLESAQPGQRMAGALDRVWARPGAAITLEVRGREKTHLTLQADHQASSAFVSLDGLAQLITDYTQVSGLAERPFQADALTYRTQLADHSPVLEVTGTPRSLVLILTLAPEKTVHLFSQGGIPVTVLDFTRQNPQGAPETTLVKGGTITYPDYPKIGNVSVKGSDFIGLDQFETFHITEIALEAKPKGMRFRLDGMANHVKTGSVQFAKDHRLTRFDTLWHNTKVTVLFAIIVWVFPTTVGAYRLLQEVRG